jgi:hypothetical protein
MGVISSSEEGGTCIEDEGAVVPLDLSNAKTTGGLITGGQVAVFVGLFMSTRTLEPQQCWTTGRLITGGNLAVHVDQWLRISDQR